jgi:hypothetical protein
LASKLSKTRLVWPTPDLFGALLTELVRLVSDLSGTQQFCFQKLFTSSLLVIFYPYLVIDLSFISFISGWILVVRSGLSNGKMWPRPPSGVIPAKLLLLMGLLLHVTTLFTPAMKRKMIVRCLSGTHLLSGPPTWPSATPRRRSKAMSMTIVKLL